jgi:hypothetical protein
MKFKEKNVKQNIDAVDYGLDGRSTCIGIRASLATPVKGAEP